MRLFGGPCSSETARAAASYGSGMPVTDTGGQRAGSFTTTAIFVEGPCATEMGAVSK